MMEIQAVLFDVGGVLVSSPFPLIMNYENELGLPQGAVSLAFAYGIPNNAFSKLERGEIVLSEFCREFDEECQELFRKKFGQDLPEEFSAAELFSRFRQEMKLIPKMLMVLKTLKQFGFKVGVVTNNWIDDIKPNVKKIDLYINNIDVVVESSKVGIRKPDKAIYQLACRQLGVDPQQVVFLDDLGVNLKSAQELGIKTILVRDTETALTELQYLLKIPLSSKL